MIKVKCHRCGKKVKGPTLDEIMQTKGGFICDECRGKKPDDPNHLEPKTK